MNESSFKAEPQENIAVRNVRRLQLENVHDLRIRHRLLYWNLGISALELPEYAHLGQIPVPIHVSRTPMRDLKRITLQDLRMDEIARGKYLILRTLESAFKIISIITVVEDHKGNAITFCISNYDSAFNTNLDDILPVGTVFILKEPFCNMSPARTVLIRCDCPSNMIVLYKGHPLVVLTNAITWINDIGLVELPKPALPREWKTRGDELSNRQKFVQASRCYLIALQELDSPIYTNDLLKRSVRLSLSAVYLLQGFFEKALDLAKKVLEDYPRTRQALSDAGQSYYSLRHYDKAVQQFGRCHTLYPYDENTHARLEQAKERLLEQETGEFNMKIMQVRRNFNSQEDNECADFVGHVKIASVPGKGFGIVSTKVLEPGSLLVVSKALGHSRLPENVVDGKVSNNVLKLVRLAQISQLVLKNPKTFGAMVYNLFDGKQLFHGSKPVQLFCDAETESEPIVDVEKIRNILENNYFDQSAGNDERNSNDRFEMLDKLCISDGNLSGLFIYPSYFNHSCRPNAVCQIFDDVMFIRAIRFIKANEEVSVSYFSWELEYPDRMYLCQKRGFVCGCQLCIEDRETSTSVQYKRENIVLQFKMIAAMVFAEDPACAPHALSNMCQLIGELDDTYKGSESLRAVMASNHLYSLLAKAFSMDKHNDSFKEIKEIECHFNTLRLFGFDPVAMEQGTVGNGTHWITTNAYLDPQVLFAVSKLIFVYNSISGIHSCCKWVEVLFALEWMYSGGDKYYTHYKYENIQRLFVPYWRQVGF